MKYIKPFAVACTLIAASLGLCAQEYPNRPVKIAVGYVAGGGPDMIARALSLRLGEILGQPLVVENKPGAGGVMATAQLAKMPPDGYNLLLGETGQLVIAPHLNKSLPFDTLKDFTPIALITTDPMLLVAHPKAKLATVQDLIREAKRNPGKIDYASSGIGTIHHIAFEDFKAKAGLDILHIPYKGSGQSIPAALGGEVSLLVTTVTAALPHLRSGALVPLAVTSSRRLPILPQVPALGELVPDFEYSSEVGILAPAGLPPATSAKLAAAIKKAVESPEFVAQFKGTSVNVTYGGPAEYAENLRRNLRKYELAVRGAKIQPE